ncbi:MAG3090 family protein [Mycoplasmopsis alligatoris]|uniref:Uncharacterized protein n=1 Tax=Mycoplasmopsis alligatoris A21JP2 TaxID=747682 RepID=D4XUW4_9BACT|nr:hypothetical protein [Mycoplasmopsis alligatoris]EFF41872.1 hypothetical protein MALL_0118 [Mycoplasmopsis alligatoris A21JP2]
MRRLQCTYSPEKNKKYPWQLKHPKVKKALAHFKTRPEAMDWFLHQEIECITWFQNEEGIWGGQVISEKDEKGVMEHEVVVENFDGSIGYVETFLEFRINPRNWTRDEEKAKPRFEAVNADYKRVFEDPNTVNYFPPEDNFERPKRRSKKDVELDQAKKDIELLILQLKEKSQGSDQSDKIKALEEQIKELEEAEKIKVVPTEFIAVLTHVSDVELRNKIIVLDIYVSKLEYITKHLTTNECCKSDAMLIKSNFDGVFNYYSSLANTVKDKKEESEQIKVLLENFKVQTNKFSKAVKPNPTLEDTEANAVYYNDEFSEKTERVAHATSFILLDDKQIVFVPLAKYEYEVVHYNPGNMPKYGLVNGTHLTKEVEAEPVKEKIFKVVQVAAPAPQTPVVVNQTKVVERYVYKEEKPAKRSDMIQYIILWTLLVIFIIILILLILELTGVRIF